MRRVASVRWLVLLISVAAGLFALAGAWLRPAWHDELYTLALARLPVGELMAALLVDSGPPLHYLLCHVLFALVGWQEGSILGTLMVRLPSVLAFALLPWVVWRARPTDNRNTLWGPLLVVAWLPLLYFGTEARAYAILALVNALVWVRGPDWVGRGGRQTIWFAILAATLPLLHYTGVISLLALPALGLFVPRQRWRALAVALGAAALPTLAWLPVMLGAPRASMAWVNMASGPGRPGASTLSVLAPAGPFPGLFEVSASPVPPWASLLILGLLVCGTVVGSVILRRNVNTDIADLNRAARLAISLLPAVGIAVLALAGIPVYFAGRTEAMVWALAAALVAIAVLGLSSIARRLVVGAYVAVGALTIAMWLVDLPKRPPSIGVEVGEVLAPMVAERDRVVVAGLWQLEVRHGLAVGRLVAFPGAAATIVDVETLPHSQAGHPGWLDIEAVTSPGLVDEARALELEARQRGSRIWLVWSPALPVEENVIPAFVGWRRETVAAGAMIRVDVLLPPEPAQQGTGPTYQ